ncbi:MAG TPA: chemotaxis protein CheA [Marmoricola sp.]|nr:chemotaxis protein CheA [Marmoricola sp.]
MDGLDEIVGEFLVESHENLDQLDRDLVELERDPSSRDLLSSVFRTLHTIKGTSGFLAFGTLESVTHVGESLLSRLRDGQMKLDPQITTVLLEMVDAVRELLASIEENGTEGDNDYADLVARLHRILDGERAEPVAEPVVEPVEFEPVPEPAPEAGGPHRRTVADSSIRVDVALLDSLMNLVGELVLTRNQMLQRAATREDIELQRTTHRLNLIAGELQEGVMKTRMQPIDNVWSKLPRVVRDLSVMLGKSVDLHMEGRDTELDKTILEAIRDPLTHLVRNSVDHGIESPEARRAAGKPERGTLVLRAFHEGGQVNIEIADDGAGIDPDKVRAKGRREGDRNLSDREAMNLIFVPGFSTAKAVTNVSGRGVGMDVVKTNIEKIGGTIDLTSTVGHGTTVRIRIPLTLAIIPALVVSAAGNRYAIPQVNLLELVRLEGEQAKSQVETVQGAPVYRLRGRLLPLVDLREQLELPAVERPTTYIAVLQADNRQFGLVVDDIKDTEEIVVKPLGRQLRAISLYAGATIMGDGMVALILDTMALARKAGMALDGSDSVDRSATESGKDERTALLVVGLADGRRAGIALDTVDRLEEFTLDRVERTGGHEVVQYRGHILPLLRLDNALHGYGEPAKGQDLQVVVCHHEGRTVGVVVNAILDIVEEELSIRSHLDTGGHHGSAVVAGHVTELIDISHAIAAFDPALLAPAN